MNASSPQRVFITGASSGIGLALAREYACRGATLGLVARRDALLTEVAAAFPQLPIAVYAADVRDAAALAAAARDFVARFGLPDVVIANAGVSLGTVTGQGDLEAFRTVIDTNCFGMAATFEPFTAALAQAGRGTLVGIASIAGVRGLPGAGAYSASKAAAMRYLEALRVELRAAGVAVVTIAPGYVRTPMTDVNTYRMPFLMEADVFARKTADAIDRRVRFAVFPWQMRIAAALLHLLPRWLFDRLFERAPRKARDENVTPPA